MAQRVGNAALVVPGLSGMRCGRTRSTPFEHDPRLIPSVTNASAEELEQMRQQCLAAKLAQYRELGVPSPRESYEAGAPFVFRRWMLGRGKGLRRQPARRGPPVKCEMVALIADRKVTQ